MQAKIEQECILGIIHCNSILPNSICIFAPFRSHVSLHLKPDTRFGPMKRSFPLSNLSIMVKPYAPTCGFSQGMPPFWRRARCAVDVFDNKCFRDSEVDYLV